MLLRPRLAAARLLLLLTAAAACASDIPAGSAPPPPGGSDTLPAGWTLVFSDEFETPGSPDPAKWGYELGYIANDEKQCYTARPENVRLESGNLWIEARKERHQGYGYTSARLNTRGRFELLYGRVEVRAKLPTGRGTWPAIWMLGTEADKLGWPACGEIDIMENVGFDPARIHGSVHTDAYNHTLGTHKTASVTVASPWEEFHVYAMEWYRDHIDVSVDGQKYFTFRNEGKGSRTWPFDKPQYLILNLAIGGTWGGQQGIDDALFPHRMLVDYVRVYQAKWTPP